MIMEPNEPLEIGKTADGRPILLLWDKSSQSYRPAVPSADGRWVWSDRKGNPLPTPGEQLQPVPAAILGGILGHFFGGPIGALIGATILFAWTATTEKKG